MNGTHPLLLGSNLRDDNSAFSVDLTNPDLISEQRIVLEKDTVHILRTSSGMEPRINASLCAIMAIGRPTFSFRSCSRMTLPTYSKSADRTATAAAAKLCGDDQLLLTYHGLDGKVRRNIWPLWRKSAHKCPSRTPT